MSSMTLWLDPDGIYWVDLQDGFKEVSTISQWDSPEEARVVAVEEAAAQVDLEEGTYEIRDVDTGQVLSSGTFDYR